jgi:hypothetical protein
MFIKVQNLAWGSFCASVVLKPAFLPKSALKTFLNRKTGIITWRREKGGEKNDVVDGHV